MRRKSAINLNTQMGGANQMAKKSKSRTKAKKVQVNHSANAVAIAPPKRKSLLTHAKLKKLAAKHKPPQSWYDETEVIW